MQAASDFAIFIKESKLGTRRFELLSTRGGEESGKKIIVYIQAVVYNNHWHQNCFNSEMFIQ